MSTLRSFQLHQHPIIVDTVGNPSQPRNSAHKTYTSLKPFLHHKAGPNRLLTLCDCEKASAPQTSQPKRSPGSYPPTCRTTTPTRPAPSGASLKMQASPIRRRSSACSATRSGPVCLKWARIASQSTGLTSARPSRVLDQVRPFTLCLFGHLTNHVL